MAAIASSGSTIAGPYRALERRNRLIGALRLLVPVLGLAVLVSLGIQMFLASLGRQFEIGRITFERNRMVVETPSYAGILADGGTYEVTAGAAETAIDRPSVIELREAHVVLNRASGVKVVAEAADADLDTALQTVTVPAVTHLTDSTGLKASLTGLTIDGRGQVATSGKVRIEYADGQSVDAESMVYDATAQLWTFGNATVIFPELPVEGPAAP